MTEHSNAYAYVIGALTAPESQEFERHLVECSDCASEVMDARAVASALSTAVAIEAPARLRASVLAAIARTPQIELASVTELKQPDSTPVEAAVAESGSPAIAPIRSSRRGRVTSLLAAAAVVAAVGFGGWAVQLSEDVSESRQTADAALSQRAQLTSLLSADDVRTVSGRFISNGNSGAVVMSEKRQMALFVADSIPKLPEGKVYEAWTIQGDPAPAGIFTADDSEAVVELSDAAFDADSIAVTVEPEGGSPKPTGDAVFNVNLPQT